MLNKYVAYFLPCRILFIYCIVVFIEAAYKGCEQAFIHQLLLQNYSCCNSYIHKPLRNNEQLQTLQELQETFSFHFHLFFILFHLGDKMSYLST